MAPFSPAATTDKAPAAATFGRPNTVAETNPCPAFACASVKRSESATLIVLHEMWMAPAPRLARTPSFPNATLSTALSSASMVNTTSPLQALATSFDAFAPASIRGLAFSRVRLNTVSSWPAAIKRDAMPAPICPNPMNPIFMISPCRRCSTSWRAAHIRLKSVANPPFVPHRRHAGWPQR